ncbi:hypothetical protein GCM10027280_06320 [Micromonospora polyrhachis]|uniref:Uncharacterized protein n=1 Tax=Micromonospora polyrhachis TaxID=1282883 RepID=A0A7W7SKG9_9ACTN|nr:hypothetical protein [Micromonospora polyrhachis]MBB4956458.1 hypothetical protein [Micromonospora polyrhachis]
MRTTIRRVRGALVAGGLGLAATAMAASPASAGSTPAPTASFVTPVYGMTCSTGVTGSLGAYNGYATCYTPNVAKWKVRVDCTAGFTYDSIIVYTSSADGWYTLGPSPTCYWGVNGVSVIELP